MVTLCHSNLRALRLCQKIQNGNIKLSAEHVEEVFSSSHVFILKRIAFHLMCPLFYLSDSSILN